MQKIPQYANISLFFLGLNFFLFLFSPSFANYSLVALVVWLLASFYYQEIPANYRNIYPYGICSLFVVLGASILRNQAWDSFALFIPFVIPLIIFWLTISLQVKDYSKGLLVLCVLYILLYVHQTFLITPIILISDISFDDFFPILLVFFPIFLTGILKRKMLYSFFWKPVHIILAICLFLILLSSFEVVIWLLLLYSFLLVGAPRMYRFGLTTLISFWVVVFFISLIWGNINLSGTVYNDITGMFQLWKFDFIENFSWLGVGEWVRDGKNTYHQFYLSFGFWGLFFYLLLIAGFLVAVFSTAIRQYARDKNENHILWGFVSSVILFLLLCTFKKDFISLASFYLIMGFWGFALGFINIVRGLKKNRV